MEITHRLWSHTSTAVPFNKKEDLQNDKCMEIKVSDSGDRG